MSTQVEVLVNGRPVKQHTHTGYTRYGNTYIEARAGTEYSIKIQNGEWKRKLAVITVDGLNVITGEPQPDSIGQGYIVGARDSLEVKGFRQDMSSVGAFKFCKSGGSYCNEKGLKGNNGVIGVRIYDEKYVPTTYYKSESVFGDNPYLRKGPSITTPWTQPPIMCKSSLNDSDMLSRSVMDSNVTCSYSSNTSSPDFDLGTTWGKKINDSVVNVEFDAVETPTATCTIYYDTKENLEAIGVVFKKEKEVCFPKAFGAFARPPKGWKG